MIYRPFWVGRIEQAWKQAPIAWLAGVRRSGKTTIALSLGDDRARYVNCDLPIVADMVQDPVLFYEGCDRPVVVFDEIHRLADPAGLLKIGADMFPRLRILATGSSTLEASRKFRDTLTGRKRHIRLVPVLPEELGAFGVPGLEKRLYHGGLPEALLSGTKRPDLYREWLDSFCARDIQVLFAFRRPDRFNALFEYLLKQSGGLFEISRTSGALGMSRPTVEKHVSALEATQAITLVRPFYGDSQKEIVKMPKLYAFDTGFVSFARGLDPLRPDDMGILWEHVVLEHLQAHLPDNTLRYWRDKAGREIDFVIVRARGEADAIECKWDPGQLDPTATKAFRGKHPRGRNFLVCPIGARAYAKKSGGLEFRVCSPAGLTA